MRNSVSYLEKIAFWVQPLIELSMANCQHKEYEFPTDSGHTIAPVESSAVIWAHCGSTKPPVCPQNFGARSQMMPHGMTSPFPERISASRKERKSVPIVPPSLHGRAVTEPSSRGNPVGESLVSARGSMMRLGVHEPKAANARIDKTEFCVSDVARRPALPKERR